MSQFEPAFDFMIPHEGGYVNDPADAGGETKFGISRASYPHLDIADLTLDEAKAIYQRDYWNGYGDLASQAVASKVFDMSVNMGSKRAVTILQQACIDSGFPTTADGAWGPNTVAAANGCDEVTLLDNIRSRAKEYYLRLVDAKPSNAKFLNGWLARAEA